MNEKQLERLTDNQQFRQIEDGVIQSTSEGLFEVLVSERDHPYTGLGSPWLDSDNQPGEQARIAFGYGSPLLPVFFDRGSRPKSRKVIETNTPFPWPMFRSSPQRDNCVLGSYTPSSAMGFDDESGFLMRDNVDDLFEYDGELVVGFLNPGRPYKLSLDGNQILSTDTAWIDFQILDNGNVLAQVMEDQDTYDFNSQFQWPEFAADDEESVFCLKEIDRTGATVWTYCPPIRSVTIDTGGGGGDGGDGDGQAS